MTFKLKVGVVGGGLVGALEACLLAKRGFDVTLFESRHDGRSEKGYFGRSINLAISHRGICALKRLSLEHIVKDQAIPMKARMIHNVNNTLNAIPYDPDGRCINSIERAKLNNLLLDEAEQRYKVKILFNHKLVDMNANRGELLFRRQEKEDDKDETTGNSMNSSKDKLLRFRFDLILGCDGAKSSVRNLLSRQTKMDFSQSYIEHGYLELRIDPFEDGSYKMEPNFLHIWPRGNHMMIALPNQDNSFTCTLFMPYDILDKIYNPNDASRFFRKNFPDSIGLIGEEQIRTVLSTVRPSPLISVKCKPYHYKDRVVLLGDAAHAMVPFYGQGMNCGFEDCLVLDELFDKHFGSENSSSPQKSSNPLDAEETEVFDIAINTRTLLGKCLAEYDTIRCPNGQAMCELAMYNYIEMRDLVNTWSFKARKYLDNLLYRLFPDKWIPLYTMVTFSRMPIDQCVAKRRRQDELLSRIRLVVWIVIALFVLIVLFFA